MIPFPEDNEFKLVPNATPEMVELASFAFAIEPASFAFPIAASSMKIPLESTLIVPPDSVLS